MQPQPTNRTVRTPSYLLRPPPVIDIHVGRQLFVDDFLVDSMSGVTRTFHSARYATADNPVLRPDRPWEGSGALSQALPYSGGVWWDGGVAKMWYQCGTTPSGFPCTNPAVKHILPPDCCAYTCLATSRDGVHWEKPELNATRNATDQGRTNIVRRVPLGFDGTTVWLDHTATDPDRRYVMAEVRGPTFDTMALLASPDGEHWTEIVNATGPIVDRSTFFFNPFRAVWVYSIKQMFSGESGGERRRSYWETPQQDFFADSLWEYAALSPWLFADDDDVHLVPDFVPQIYNVDVTPYESLLLGMFSVLECKHFDHPSCPGVCGGATDCSRGTQEYNEIFAAWSRDGFQFSRPPAPRVPFAGADQSAKHADRGNRSAWNYQNVQSVAGGMLVFDDELYIYVSGRGYRANTCSAGLAKLRRDGFASLDTTPGAASGAVTSRPLVWAAELRYLFVNFQGSGLRVSVLDATNSSREIAPFGRNTSVPFSGDSTRQLMSWATPHATHGLAPVAGRVLRLRFEFEAGSSLFSFWLAETRCGESRGWVAAGGPGLDGNRDSWGGCKPPAATAPIDAPPTLKTDDSQTKSSASPPPRTRSSFDFGWRFRRGAVVPEAPNTTRGLPCDPVYDASTWRQLTLPHDYVLEGDISEHNKQNGGSFFAQNVSWYRKQFELPASAKGQLIWLTFDGVFRSADIYINGAKVKHHEEGYTSWYAYIHNASVPLRFGARQKNLVAVFVDSTQPELWCYEGGGMLNTRMLNTGGP